MRFISIKEQLNKRVKNRREIINKAWTKFIFLDARLLGYLSTWLLGYSGTCLLDCPAARDRKLQEIKLAETADHYRKLISAS